MIILYSQAGCGQCKMIHMLLDKNKIEYQEYQLDRDITIEELRALGVQHTPTLSVDGKLLAGKEIFSFINERK